MHPRVIWAIIRKDFLDIWLNKSTLAGLLFPLILSLVWFLIGHLAGGTKTGLLIYNPGNSPLVQILVNTFPGSQVTQAGSQAEVQAAFGPNGAKVKPPYAMGVVLPVNFDQDLQAGSTPSVALYLNDATLNPQTEALLQADIINYGRSVASPQPPVKISVALINPSPNKVSVILGQVYTPLALLLSLMVGTTFIPLLLLEEKEKKTMRMLMVSPASFSDILAAKLLVVLVFQLAITSAALAILGGISGNVLLVLVYVLLSAFFSLSLGLLFGSLFNTVTTAGTVAGFVSVVYILGGLFVGTLGQLLGQSPIATIARLLPTYYLADGVVSASQRLGTAGSNLVDIGVAMGSTILLLGISAWALRRQAAVEAAF
jgi:ABC-2 type transport system permease protein